MGHGTRARDEAVIKFAFLGGISGLLVFFFLFGYFPDLLKAMAFSKAANNGGTIVLLDWGRTIRVYFCSHFYYYLLFYYVSLSAGLCVVVH